jgi:4-hydroxybenzoate polyprenyltransferase
MNMLVKKYIAKIENYLSLVKFAHTIFAMPFALLGFFMATILEGALPDWKLFILVIFCMVFARNAAMSFNRWADRHIDSTNPRTSLREIPARIIGPRSALAFCILNALLFVACTWFINRLCFYLSPVALAVILGYSFTKRFTILSHFILGLGLALAPTGAFIAVTGSFQITPVILSLAVLFWVSGFDIIYALQDEDFDRNNNLHSVPVRIGRKRALYFSAMLHLITVSVLAIIGLSVGFSIIYWIGFVIFTGLMIYQHSILSPDNLSRLNLAFFTLNGIASLLFSTFAIADLLFSR